MTEDAPTSLKHIRENSKNQNRLNILYLSINLSEEIPPVFKEVVNALRDVLGGAVKLVFFLGDSDGVPSNPSTDRRCVAVNLEVHKIGQCHSELLVRLTSFLWVLVGS